MIRTAQFLALLAVLEAVFIGVLLANHYRVTLTPNQPTFTKRRPRAKKLLRTTH